ncbi:MAG TPA: NAD(P)/FAD-dependent oxidoreductase [Edaphocola sp.]|nr:NAD(P)/FAD-dependent oxidoreductase [Edaphocola sp.]
MNQNKTIVIIGAGAAGFFCAANIKRDKNTKIIILEKSQKVLSKVSISGGGRCNVTHNNKSIPEMAKCYPRGEQFVKKTFHQFFVQDTIQWFQERGLALKTESDNRMFPVSDSSQSVIDVLQLAAKANQVELRLGQQVEHIKPIEHQFELTIKGQKSVIADQLVIATGGFPKLEQFNWMAALGHTVVPPVPSLFTFNVKRHPITDCMGLSIQNANVKIMGSKFQEKGPLLITHWGLSGPAVLKLSAKAALFLAEKDYQFSILVNFIADKNEEELRAYFLSYQKQHPSQKISNTKGLEIPQRLLDLFLMLSGIEPEQRWTDLSKKLLNKLINQISNAEFSVSGKTTFKEEFVTAGGIDVKEINHETMESKLLPNLYFIGEILNIDGITGGFNFQNAWTSAFIAAKSLR